MLGVTIKVPSIKKSHVPTGLHLASKMVASTLGFWKALGNLESFALAKDLHSQEIIKPIFVSGVARSGSTILTEVLSQHPRLACHHYSDFPITWIPYWWNSLRKRLPLPKQEPQERAHRDRLMVTSNSPEAIEEVLWMHFFPAAHKPDRSHVMGGQESHPQFEKFYRDHIHKLLLVRNRQRYVAKNNYHATRIEYLLKLFPDARFIIPIRDPVQQVASLLKQHRRFSQQNVADSRVSRQLQLSGHYEFGPRRCPIIVDESRLTHYGQELEDVAWYANQWADVYGFLHKRMEENQTLAKACLVVRYEDVCSQTSKSLGKIFAHLDLADQWAEQLIAAYEPIISAPDYYQPGFSAQQQELIQKLTRDTAESYAYI
jgi:sulfotransferase family protein